MTQPTPYVQQTDYSEELDTTEVPGAFGAHLDVEFQTVRTSIGQTQDNLALIQRDDGALRNSVVTPDSLSTATKALIGAGESGQLNWTPKGAWATATAYVVGDVVEEDGVGYVCASAHTSGTFATDHTAAKWITLGNDVIAMSYTSPDTDAVPVTVFSILRSRVRPQFFGAVGDGVTNDTAAILKAMQRAANRRCLCEIPGTDNGYRLNTAIVATDLDYLMVEGEGILIPVGGNALTLDSTTHARISGIGIYGTSGSGHGIELINGSHLNKFSKIWGAWVDGDVFKVTSGQSNTFTECDADANNGFRPLTLLGGLADGSPERGFHVASHASNNTNNTSCINCRINACGGTVSLQVGDSSGMVDSFAWVGGLIQGSGVYKEVYLRTKDARITGTHIEPPVGATANYVLDIDRCSNTVVEGGSLQGDAILRGACTNSGLRGVTMCGVDISATSVGCFVRDGSYRNITTGPAGGNIINRAGRNADVTDMRNATSEFSHASDNSSERRAEYLRVSFEDWLGGASATTPAGLSRVLGTLTRDSSVVHGGTYSAKMVMSADLTQYLFASLAPIASIRGRTVVVEAWVYNLTTAALASIQGVTGGGASAGTRTEGSYQADAWERMLVSFDVPSDATSFQVRFTGVTGTVYWDDINITVDNFHPSKTRTLDNSATPTVTEGGRMVPTVFTGGTTGPITDFLEAHPGIPFTLLGRHVVTITHNASKLVTKSGANISMTDGGVAHFVRGLDTGYIYEI